MAVEDTEEPTDPVESEVGLLAAAEGDVQDEIADNLVAELLSLWLAFTAFYDGLAVADFAARAAALVVNAQRVSGRITESFLRVQIQRMGFDLPATQIVDLPTHLRMGATTEEVYQRPIREVRYLESVGTPREEAVESARDRLDRLARTDLQLARTLSAQQVMYRFPRATGWRRVIHPELGNVCGLCVVAADRIYQRIQRMDIHPGCKCTLLPVVGGIDPGGQLNAEDLKRIYASVGSTDGRKLSQTRIEIQANGEIGPILTPKQVEMRGPAQVRRQMSPEAAQRRKEQLQRQVDELRMRQNRSQWHEDRLEQLEELLAAA